MTSAAEDVDKAERIVLCGVGAFDMGVSNLKASGLFEAIQSFANQRCRPILGICLGMQLLAEGSEEGQLPGLGLVGGHCVRFRSSGDDPLRVPHMGWNYISPLKSSVLLRALPEPPRFYFVHSYHLELADSTDALCSTEYGSSFTSALERGSILGVQFHPEKSHRFGLRMLDNFLRGY